MSEAELKHAFFIAGATEDLVRFAELLKHGLITREDADEIWRRGARSTYVPDCGSNRPRPARQRQAKAA